MDESARKAGRGRSLPLLEGLEDRLLLALASFPLPLSLPADAQQAVAVKIVDAALGGRSPDPDERDQLLAFWQSQQQGSAHTPVAELTDAAAKDLFAIPTGPQAYDVSSGTAAIGSLSRAPLADLLSTALGRRIVEEYGSAARIEQLQEHWLRREAALSIVSAVANTGESAAVQPAGQAASNRELAACINWDSSLAVEASATSPPNLGTISAARPFVASSALTWYDPPVDGDPALVERPAGVVLARFEAEEQGERAPSPEGLSALMPAAGSPMPGHVHFDLEALERNVDALFCRLGRLGADWCAPCATLNRAVWLAIAVAAAYEVGNLRKQPDGDRHPSVGDWSGLALAPPEDWA